MSPQLPLLVAALAGCLLPARGCVTCDAKVVEALYHFEMEYLPSRSQELQGVLDRIKYLLNDFRKIPDLNDQHLGVVDSPTLKKLSMDFLKNLKRITNSEEQGFCPNKCGQMLQTLIWCHNCLKRIHTCRKPIDCGVHEVVVHELEDLVLDCELSWHRISAGVNNYTFYRVLGSNSLLLSVGKEPTLTKTMVRLEDAGTYRCELANMKTSRAGVTHFHVRVLPQRAGGAVRSSPTTTTATTEYEFPTDWDLSLLFPTALANPSECPKSEDVLRGRLIGLLLWGLLVLLIAFVTAILCFRPGKVINYIKAWSTNQKEAAQQAQTAMEPQAALESQGGREPQGAQKPQSARKPQAAPKPSVSKGKLSASKLQ
ncbi:izumo sperm-egg fusion protein 1 isoform X3 [Vulpes vulpes]|uniref:Izumo sperm-egg fusion protein 1 isoform X3 n=2 Tax=Vulpes vulpes TaxID=9627 RepID=A0A3Q7UQT5_VULVU|nr:izumo sperm-egg fusion protein 1 isoform X2 [Vulpes vulpes]